VETELGRKTRIHQPSCNEDFSCLEGDCPSFVTAVPRGAPVSRGRSRVAIDAELPESEPRVPRDCHIVMTGIGGTGVVTVNQILGTAALLDGRFVRGLDQTGLSQKGDPVVSHLKISSAPLDISNKVGAGTADCYLGFDLLVADNFVLSRPSRVVVEATSNGSLPNSEQNLPPASSYLPPNPAFLDMQPPPYNPTGSGAYNVSPQHGEYQGDDILVTSAGGCLLTGNPTASQPRRDPSWPLITLLVLVGWRLHRRLRAR